MKTRWIVGGVGAAVLAGYLMGRRKQGALGGWLPSWSTSESATKIANAARKQVSLAQSGRRLSDYRSAEDLSLFWSTAPNVALAELKASYWLAVAARVSGKASLATSAKTLFARGLARLPASANTDTNAISAVYQAAGAQVAAAGRTANLKAIAKALGVQGTSKTIEGKQSVERDRAPVTRAAEASASDTWALMTSGADWTRAAIGLPKPTGAPYPAYMRWIPRIAAGLGIALVLRVAFSPQYKAAKALVVDTHGKVRALIESRGTPA